MSLFLRYLVPSSGTHYIVSLPYTHYLLLAPVQTGARRPETVEQVVVAFTQQLDCGRVKDLHPASPACKYPNQPLCETGSFCGLSIPSLDSVAHAAGEEPPNDDFAHLEAREGLRRVPRDPVPFGGQGRERRDDDV